MDGLYLAEKATILVIDDTPDDLALMSNLLKDDYKVKIANGGEKALKIMASESPPDLILLDIMMPCMDGYEVCRRLKRDPRTMDIPVIFLTAKTEVEDEKKGLELGAVDYITKPISPPIVCARIYTHLALRKAKAKLEEQNHVLLHERELVEDIIARMRSTQSFDGRCLRYLISPVERSNGDILLSSFTPDGRQWVLVGDFTGHGLCAAIAAPLISYVFYPRVLEGKSIEATLEEINIVLYQKLPPNVFMVGCLVEISADRKKIKLWNAGMPQCLFMRECRVQRRFDSRNTPLGITAQIDIRNGHESFDVQAGDQLYIFSDGVSEMDNPDGELFGYARLENFMCGMAAGSKAPEELLVLLEEFHGSTDFGDDITLVEILV